MGRVPSSRAKRSLGQNFLGDPNLQYLAWLGDLKVYCIAAAVALMSVPRITPQLDGQSSTVTTPTT